MVSYEARLRVANSEGLLRAGMTATATIATDKTANALLVPNAALRFDPGETAKEEGGVFGPQQFGLEREEDSATIGVGSRQTVHIVGEDGLPKPVEVVTGASDGRRTLVTAKDLAAGAKVIVGESAVAK